MTQLKDKIEPIPIVSVGKGVGRVRHSLVRFGKYRDSGKFIVFAWDKFDIILGDIWFN